MRLCSLAATIPLSIALAVLPSSSFSIVMLFDPAGCMDMRAFIACPDCQLWKR